MKKIAIVVASVVKNLELAKNIDLVIKESHQHSEIINLVELNLPLYTSILEDSDGIPNEVIALSKKLLEFDAYIIVAPEYNGSMPPVLTNAIAWVSRIGDDFRALFNQKFIAIASHSGGGGLRGNDAMRAMFTFLGANIISREILTNYEKPYKKETAISIVNELIKYS